MMDQMPKVSRGGLPPDVADEWPEGADGHPSEALLMAAVDGALPSSANARVRAHAALCGTCGATVAELEELKQWVGGALESLDAQEPSAWRTRPPLLVVSSARVRAAKSKPRGALYRSQPVLWAASALLLVAGAASAALWSRHERAVRAAAAQSLVHSTGAAAPTQSIVVPTDAVISIAITNAARGSRIVMVRDDTLQLGVRVDVVAAANPVFRPARDTIAVSVAGQIATIRIYLPRYVRTAAVLANGRQIARLDEGVVTPEQALGKGVLVTW
jgi:hypothetical protein